MRQQVIGVFTPLYLAVVLLTGLTCVAQDGTVKQSGHFTTSSTWLEDVVPGGPGSTLSVKGNYTITTIFTNAVIGHILTPADATVSALTSGFNINLPVENRTSDNPDPVYGTYRFGVFTNYLTFDSGSANVPASIRCLPSLTSKYRYAINTPILLKSDLEVEYTGLGSGTWGNPLSAIWLGRDISEEGGSRAIRVTFGQEDMQLMLMGNNTFSGNLVVNKGIVRAGNTLSYDLPGNQFGVENTLIATSGVATIDLNGYHFGPEKPILIGGRGANGMGTLISGCQSPAVTSVWAGPVTLMNDAAIGGTINRYPRYEGGNLRIDGNITDEGRHCSLENVSWRNLVLTGNNTYSKGTILTSGFLSALTTSSLGSGPLIFNGGAFALDSATGVDPSAFTLVSTNSKPIQIILDGTDYTPAHPFVGFTSGLTKGGPGTLILKQNNAYTGSTVVARGDLILDYSENSEAKTDPEGSIGLSADARLIIQGGTEVITGQKSRTLSTYAGSNARVINNSTMPFSFNFFSLNTFSTLNLEGEGPFLDVQTYVGGESSAYPNILPPNILFKSKDWAIRNANYSVSNFTDYASSWDGSNKHVDVTAELAASVPAEISVSTLRFNTPNGGTPIVLNLSGTNFIKGGAILVTEAMGSTEVHITGGAISRMGSGSIIVYNYNTQAVVRIDSQLLGFVTIDTNSLGVATGMTIPTSVGFMKAGPGKVILGELDNGFDAYTYIVDGELEISGPKCLGIGNWHGSWKSIQNFVHVFNGATLTTRETFEFCRETITGITNQIALRANPIGGIINVADAGDTITKSSVNPGPTLYNGGRFVKRGKGTWLNDIGFGVADDIVGANVIARNFTMHFDVEEGAIALRSGLTSSKNFTGEGNIILTVRNNAVLKGAGFLFGKNGGANGGGNAEDVAARQVLYIEETGATVDLNGTSINMGESSTDSMVKALDWIYGPGTLTVTNSVENSASFDFKSLLNNKFTGRFDARLATTVNATYGGGLPNGEIYVPENISHRFRGNNYPTYPLHFGRLTGTGAFGGTGVANSDSDCAALIGCDDGQTFEFGGYLWGTWESANRGAFRFIKVGNNTWRISGTTNAMTTSVTIRKGTILVGANSPGNDSVGALGKERIIMSDSQTVASDALALLTDGPYTVGNEIILMNYAPDSQITLGGNQTSGPSAFTNDLSVTRDVCLNAENTDENGVTFSGTIIGSGGIIKTGPGTVYLTDAGQHTGPITVQDGTLAITGNTTLNSSLTMSAGASRTSSLSITGDLTIGSGITLAIEPDGLVRDQIYTLASWTGTRSGVFSSVTGLPINWHIGYFSDHIELYYAPPGTLIRLL